MKLKISDKKHTYSGWRALAVLFAMSFLSVVFQAIMQNGINPLGYLSYFYSPSIFVYNFVPVFCLYVFFYCISGSIRAAFLFSNIPLTVFLLINEFKILFRDEPFKATDITLITETANMLENYVLSVSPKIVLLTVIMILSMILVFKKIRSGKIRPLIRIGGILISIAVFTGMWFGVYSNYTIFSETKILGNQYREADVFANKGLVFSFLSSFSGVKYEKPKGYSTKKAEEILSEYKTENDEKLPNVIAIMSEAFFDPQLAENIEFLPGLNPLDEYNKLKEDSLSGSIFVPGFAGGTAQTEFEFISGANITLIDPSMPTIYKNHIKSSAYNLASAFKDKGFETLAIHPGHAWFYNRQNVYKSLEFDNSIFMEDLPKDVEKINFYISDEVTKNLIIENYKKHLEKNPGKGYFNFTVTIQNHGPYKESEPKIRRIKRPEGLTDTEYNILENYLENLHDASMLLCDLTEYLNTIDTPTVVVFFGDHLPYLDPEYKDYEAIGYSLKNNDRDTFIRQHSTPYIIWGNKALKETGCISEEKDGGLISANFLPVKLLSYINADLSPYFMFVKEMCEIAPIISSDVKMYEGEFINKVPDSLEQKYNDYRILQYYNLNEYKK